MAKISKFIYHRCAPLFLENKFYCGKGHTEETENGTATFVTFDQEYYVITCKHVIEAAINKFDDLVCRMNFENIDVDLSFLVTNTDNNQTINCPSFNISKDYDLAIARVDGDFIRDLPKKHKNFFWLDNLETKEILGNTYLHACGFPTLHKYTKGKFLAAPLVDAYLPILNDYLPTSDDFGLQGEVARKEKIFYFSGMSGGPICYRCGKQIYLLGIIYEGSPSSPNFDEINEKFLPDECKYIRGYTISKERWINLIKTTIPACKYFNKFESFEVCDPNPFEIDKYGVEWPKKHLSISIVGRL